MLRSILTTASEVIGLGLATAGVGAFSWPAALIFAGIALVVIGMTQA